MTSTSPNLLRPIAASLLLATVAGCAAIGERGQPLVPTAYQTRTGPYVVFTNSPLAADDPVLKGLAALRAQFEESLGLKAEVADLPIEVYVLSDRKTFEHFLTFYYPGLPPRRAFFIAQGERRVVYTFRGDRLEEDIRHEATHALLHLVVGDVPLWLDEGLAEHFEVAEPGGVNREHLAKLPLDLKDGWRPDLERLEGLDNVRRMTPRDYRESWAWTHYLMHGPSEGRAALLAYLGDLRRQGDVKPLSRRLPGDSRERVAGLLKHIEALRTPDAPSLAAAEPKVRLQDGPIEVEPLAPPPKRRSLLGRLLGKMFP